MVEETVQNLKCSRRGCSHRAQWVLSWSNPKLRQGHKKQWLACDEHLGFLTEYVRVRAFPYQIAPVSELSPDVNEATDSLPVSDLVLQPPTWEDRDSAETLALQCHASGFDFFADDSPLDFATRLRRWQAEAAGRDLPEGRVPSDFLLAKIGGVVVGRASIRHRLNQYLEDFGGHIGYAVGPNYRGRGYATRILQLSLARLGALGVSRALLTVNPTNLPSIAVIEKCHGQLEDQRTNNSGEVFLRYWIDIDSVPKAESDVREAD